MRTYIEYLKSPALVIIKGEAGPVAGTLSIWGFAALLRSSFTILWKPPSTLSATSFFFNFWSLTVTWTAAAVTEAVTDVLVGHLNGYSEPCWGLSHTVCMCQGK